MIKLKSFVFLLICVYFLTGCGINYKYNYSDLERDVKSIEIIEMKNAQLVSYETIKIIESDSTLEFLKEFSNIKFIRVFGDPVGLAGECILFKYDNGNFEIIGKYYISKYNKDNDLIEWKNYYANEQEFDNLLYKYKE